jgi:alkane 1-monooxygenase
MILERLNPSQRTMQIVRVGALALPLLMPFAMYRSLQLGTVFEMINAFAFLPLFLVFGGFTLLDYIIGKDTVNMPLQAPQFRSWYRLLPLVSVPLHLGAMVWAMHIFVTAPFTWMGQLGWVLSMGTVSGILAINVAHELIHKPSRLEQIGGGLLLSSVAYGSFKIEHVYGHHAWVATDKDPSSAKRGETIYTFVPRAIVRNIANAFQLQASRLERQGKPYWSWHNELLWWTGLTLVMAVAATAVFGKMGLIFFVGQALIAVVQLEIINYIEHYGLRREHDAQGRPERVTPMHSWNSSYFLTNAYLFQLQRHSDHHANAARPYQDLQHHDGAPQLPGGYGAMMMLTLLPPLWRTVIHPRLDRIKTV